MTFVETLETFLTSHEALYAFLDALRSRDAMFVLLSPDGGWKVRARRALPPGTALVSLKGCGRIPTVQGGWNTDGSAAIAFPQYAPKTSQGKRVTRTDQAAEPSFEAMRSALRALLKEQERKR